MVKRCDFKIIVLCWLAWFDWGWFYYDCLDFILLICTPRLFCIRYIVNPLSRIVTALEELMTLENLKLGLNSWWDLMKLAKCLVAVMIWHCCKGTFWDKICESIPDWELIILLEQMFLNMVMNYYCLMKSGSQWVLLWLDRGCKFLSWYYVIHDQYLRNSIELVIFDKVHCLEGKVWIASMLRGEDIIINEWVSAVKGVNCTDLNRYWSNMFLKMFVNHDCNVLDDLSLILFPYSCNAAI